MGDTTESNARRLERINKYLMVVAVALAIAIVFLASIDYTLWLT